MKTKLCAVVLLAAVSGCGSLQPVQPPTLPQPDKPKVAAWILEPQPPLLPLLNKIISPFDKASSTPKQP